MNSNMTGLGCVLVGFVGDVVSGGGDEQCDICFIAA